jgi:hypothetical protein
MRAIFFARAFGSRWFQDITGGSRSVKALMRSVA